MSGEVPSCGLLFHDDQDMLTMLNYSALYDPLLTVMQNEDTTTLCVAMPPSQDSSIEATPLTAPPMKQRSVRKVRTRKEMKIIKRPPTRSGWKCTSQYLLESLTAKERKTLIARDVPVPTATTASLSKQEEQTIRKGLRKIRNVASAQQSRLEQKNYIGKLEKTGAAYKKSNAKLAKSNERLLSENRSLRDQVAHWKALAPQR